MRVVKSALVIVKRKSVVLNYDYVMTKRNELRLVADLMNALGKQDAVFLEHCRTLKHLALVDPPRAINEYHSLAKQLLVESHECTIYSELCKKETAMALRLIQRGVITLELIESLNLLRRSFLDQAVRPALSAYLKGTSNDLKSLQNLYLALFKIDELITIASFILRMSHHSS